MRKGASEGKPQPCHVGRSLDRRHDEVEIALDFPRALFEILMVYATP